MVFKLPQTNHLAPIAQPQQLRSPLTTKNMLHKISVVGGLRNCLELFEIIKLILWIKFCSFHLLLNLQSEAIFN